MRGEVLDVVERRRRWSDEQKLSILMEVGLRGATVSDVARRHAITRQQVCTWRRELKRHGAFRPDDRPVFLPIGPPPVLLAPVEPATEAPHPDPGSSQATAMLAVEIVLGNGRKLCVSADVDDAALARLIRVVETA
jgi:transposase